MRIIARSTTSKYLNLVSIFLTFVKLKHNFSSQFYFLMIWHNMAELKSSTKKPLNLQWSYLRCTMKKTCITIPLIIFLTEERCTYLCDIMCWNFFRSPHLHVPGGLSVARDYNPEWSVVTGVCALWNVYWWVDLLACLIQYIWNPKFISISMVSLW